MLMSICCGSAYGWLRKEAAAGVDGVTWDAYGEGLEHRLADLHGRIHRGAYRALPSRRVYIPKPDGRQRPLGIAALEDKIVQRTLVEVLNAIWEGDFLGFSYGFRPGRGQHDALDALAVGISRCKVNWIQDADIAGFPRVRLRRPEDKLRHGQPRVADPLRGTPYGSVWGGAVIRVPTAIGTRSVSDDKSAEAVLQQPDINVEVQADAQAAHAEVGQR
jgi:hypothetical protein